MRTPTRSKPGTFKYLFSLGSIGLLFLLSVLVLWTNGEAAPPGAPLASATATRTSTPTPRDTSTPTASPPANPYDLNGDGVVDIFDVSLIAQQWQASSAPGRHYDLNGNGVIDIGDVLLIAAHVD